MRSHYTTLLIIGLKTICFWDPYDIAEDGGTCFGDSGAPVYLGPFFCEPSLEEPRCFEYYHPVRCTKKITVRIFVPAFIPNDKLDVPAHTPKGEAHMNEAQITHEPILK